mgnify:CR=1 FL=1
MRVRDENGTDITDTFTEDEKRSIYEELFGGDLSEGDNSEQLGEDNSDEMLEITVTSDDMKEYRVYEARRGSIRFSRESKTQTELSDQEVLVGQ